MKAETLGNVKRTLLPPMLLLILKDLCQQVMDANTSAGLQVFLNSAHQKMATAGSPATRLSVKTPNKKVLFTAAIGNKTLCLASLQPRGQHVSYWSTAVMQSSSLKSVLSLPAAVQDEVSPGKQHRTNPCSSSPRRLV